MCEISLNYFLLFPVVTKPGTCPVIETPVPVPHCPLPAPTDLCEQDGDCSGPEKCCRRTYCGGNVCGDPIGTLARWPLSLFLVFPLSGLQWCPQLFSPPHLIVSPHSPSLVSFFQSSSSFAFLTSLLTHPSLGLHPLISPISHVFIPLDTRSSVTVSAAIFIVQWAILV